MRHRIIFSLTVSFAVSTLIGFIPSAYSADSSGVAAKKLEIHRTLLECYKAMGRTNEAAAEYGVLVGIAPNDPQIQYDFGSYLFKNGKTALAITHLRRAAQLAPGQGDYQAALGSLLMTMKDYDGAVKAYQAAYGSPGGARFADALKTAMEYQQNQKLQVQYQKQVIQKKQDTDEED
jgi:tetratricopeptide (TPR) repeat protein